MWQTINQVLEQIDDLVWGVPLMVLILAGGILLTARLGLLQIRRLPLALQWMVKNEENGEGEVTSFGALCTALSATIGTGNIVGVATAIAAGGPGALFWMELAAFLGMATKYAEGLLAVKYRVVDDSSHVLGGPFYYIERGMGANWRWLARIFAFFGVCVGLFGIGTFSQVNGISSAVNHFFDPNQSWTVTIPGIGTYSWTVVIASLILSVCVALVLIGGIKRIANVSQVIVPFMAVVYILLSVALLLCNLSAIPQAAVTIVTGAFNPSAVTGGIVGTMIISMQKGIARGIFSNEAGLGSAPIAAAAAQTKEPVRQGLVSMTGTFIDTIVICTMTGLSIVLTGAWQVEGLTGVAITNYAFNSGLPLPAIVSSFLLMLCLVFFAFTTILGWDYYSERCLEYLTGGNMKVVKAYRWLYIFAVFIGPYMTVKAVWTIADIFNGLMALPNMIALFALSGVVTDETKRFFQKDRVSCLTSLSRHSL
ncbi:alanine/glycine:cation symporter family protein [Enterocloster citroniae]|uniref:alanine/glycine:cation symporter family protein n=1 Tax=Enterocloster citroniae TaxID=358743 RepID=UPI00349EE9F3